ncbi:MAG: hypothetical protein O3B68_01475, partial [Planctomycetota bacterium]|nr:hypothetical protein [Planctomycetota bacterium]
DTVGFQYETPKPEWFEALHETMPHVKNFEFGGREEHIAAISKFEQVEYIQIEPPTEKWIDMLSKKPSVRRIVINGHVSTAGLEQLAKFPDLTELTLSKGITDEDFRVLSKSKRLTRLAIYTKTKEWTATGKGLAELADLDPLETLTFGNNELPPSIDVQALKKQLPYCSIEFAEAGQMKRLPAEPRP